jgi:hypothetical protein
VEREDAEAIFDQGREVVVAVLTRLEKRVVAQDERIAKLERDLGRSSRNSSQPPSADPPRTPPRSKSPTGRKQGAQPGHEGRGRPLLPAWAVDQVVDHWPTVCGCGHVFCQGDLDAEIAEVLAEHGHPLDDILGVGSNSPP